MNYIVWFLNSWFYNLIKTGFVGLIQLHILPFELGSRFLRTKPKGETKIELVIHFFNINQEILDEFFGIERDK